ncbi:hypothetical protein ACFE33_06705 [Falsihalocynthiibacter sp. SS001]|uniref:hypothetical protein n=1 Tax=Falsihalocynthiibacter sp. SS001 TaxID=3349698 RepID=UPI0036D34C0F
MDSQKGARIVGYEHAEVVDVSFESMCQIAPWDYPILYWLRRLLAEDGSVLDAGGHMGTKFIAFQDYLELTGVNWTVYDLEAVVTEGRRRQAAGELPSQVHFTSDPASRAIFFWHQVSCNTWTCPLLRYCRCLVFAQNIFC